MSLINSVRHFPTKNDNPRPVLLMCGFGGSIWQTRRLVSVLTRAGYNVTALDFTKDALSMGDVTLLPALVDEVAQFAENEARNTDQKILLVGISLGSLLALNLLRRLDSFNRAVMITGGNIVTVAQHIFGHNVWPQSHEELSVAWTNVNMFSNPADLANKHALFVLPTKDRLIDPEEVIAEVDRQNAVGNHIALVKRNRLGHIGTIFIETVVFPKRVLGYIQTVETIAEQ